jgi:hypothetical protein
MPYSVQTCFVRELHRSRFVACSSPDSFWVEVPESNSLFLSQMYKTLRKYRQKSAAVATQELQVSCSLLLAFWGLEMLGDIREGVIPCAEL